MRLKQGDIQGLKMLVDAYQVKATRAAYLITGDRAQAEDIVQGAFVKAYERIHQFDESRAFWPWFVRIVHNDALQTLRRERRVISWDGLGDVSVDALLPYHDDNPEHKLEAAELREAVRVALTQLSPEQRSVIVLRYYLDLTESEAAYVLNSPLGTIKWRMHAARRQLSVLLRQFATADKGETLS